MFLNYIIMQTTFRLPMQHDFQKIPFTNQYCHSFNLKLDKLLK